MIQLRNKIASKLAFAYLIFFLPCYLLVFSIFYFSVANFLKQKDRNLIETVSAQLQENFDREGLVSFEKINNETKLSQALAHVVIAVTDGETNLAYFHPHSEFDKINYHIFKSKIIFESTRPFEKWLYISSKDGDDNALELKQIRLDAKHFLFVGSSTDDRDELIDNLERIFFITLAPLILISIFVSIFISNTFLKPVKNLVSVISKIKSGSLSERAQLPKQKDEVFDLTIAFNEMIEQIENLIRAMKETLDNVAHDLKTPIARIKISSEMALESNSPQKIKQSTEETLESLDSINQMIESIMTMAQFDSKTFKLKIENLESRPLIEEVVALYDFVAEEKNIQIICDTENYQFTADRVLIKRALANLIDNAIKYSPTHTSIKIFCEKFDRHLRFHVIDSGIGLSHNEQQKIWQRLYRADKSRNTAGLGLGLNLVKAFVEAHGGTVNVQSREGHGSDFYFDLKIEY